MRAGTNSAYGQKVFVVAGFILAMVIIREGINPSPTRNDF